MDTAIYFFKPEHGTYGWAGADYNIAGRSYLRAIDYKTGKIVWSTRCWAKDLDSAGVLTTASV
jgi:alcohol dehydrogenase (cytochrome c)